jgi:hypothetical protein
MVSKRFKKSVEKTSKKKIENAQKIKKPSQNQVNIGSKSSQNRVKTWSKMVKKSILAAKNVSKRCKNGPRCPVFVVQQRAGRRHPV